ncbi:SDR family NAD(P)-dependent oxidoreductase [Candidatus Woesearchaeota archaeon]|nr:SDR family NAD(P)-dependent oxidoreductase [Candidatus Woesearchaeota archaeon]
MVYTLQRMDGQEVLIIGGAGAIGSCLAHRCVELGARVTILDNLTPDTGANLANLREIRGQVEFIQGDLRDEKLKELVKEKNIIFNCAAQVSHTLSMKDPYLDLDINIKGTLSLLEACRHFNPTVKIIHTGSRSEFGAAEKLAIGESCPDNPADIFSANKLGAELYYKIYYHAYGLFTVTLRLTNVYGPRAQLNNPGYNFINFFVGKVLQNQEITVYEPGTQLRDICYVDDAIEAMILAAQNNAAGKVYIVGTGKGTCPKELAQLMVSTAKSGSFRLIPWPPERKVLEPGDIVLDYSLIKKELGWEPHTPIEEGIKKTIDFYRERLGDYLIPAPTQISTPASTQIIGGKNMLKIKILVTGALGHIGSKLIRDYAAREDVEEIRVLDNLSTQRYCSLFNLPENVKYTFIEGDILKEDDLAKAMSGIDVVIHLAAITDAPSTINNREATFQVNLEGTEKVLKAAARAGVKKFLFPSTTSVYGEAEGLVDENYDNYKPSSPYAEAKFAAEKIVQDFCKAHGLNTNVLRLGTIFRTSIGMRFHTAVNKFCYLAALNKPLTVWENALDQKRPYLGLNDAIRAFQFAEKNGQPGELYNVLTDNYTVRDMVEAISSFIPDVKIQLTKSPILNQKSYFVSDQKFRKLGFVPQDKVKECIWETLKLFKAIKNE